MKSTALFAALVLAGSMAFAQADAPAGEATTPAPTAEATAPAAPAAAHGKKDMAKMKEAKKACMKNAEAKKSKEAMHACIEKEMSM
jgi:hypothetical protein